MKVTIVGTGYVGLVTGTCLAETGNSVSCVDVNHDKINKLRSGRLTIYDPGWKFYLIETLSRTACILQHPCPKE